MKFDELAQSLRLEIRVPSSKEVTLLEPSERPSLAQGVVLVGSSTRLVPRLRPFLAGCFVRVEEDFAALEQTCLASGYGLALLPPWLSPATALDEARRRLAEARSQEALGMVNTLELLLARLADYRGFLEALGAITGLPLALLAPWGEVLAWVGAVPAHHPKEVGRGPRHLALEAGEWRLVAYGEGERLNRVVGLLELAARLLRLRSRERSLERAQEESLGAAFLDELLLGEAEPERALAFGLQPGPALALALIEAPAPVGRHRLAETRRREVLVRLKQAAGAYLERLGVPYLLSGRGARAVVLWQVHDVAREVQGLLSTAPEGVRLGYSAIHTDPSEVQAAYREALIALKAARAGEALGFGQLDPVAWVLLQQSPEDLKALVERFLPVSPKELRTLERYLEHSGDLTATAEALHVHPNTLRYRLQKIEERLGASLRSPETLARLHLALRARSLAEEGER